LTALENVTLSAELNGSNGTQKKSTELLSLVGLENRNHHYPAQLSGGEQQRLSLARAFINEPTIVLADEPTGNLDSENSKRILDLMTDLHRNKKSTIALVTHEPDVANKAERIIVLDDGKIIKDSLPA
jgi:putative ABC transport system ATP-binding protein